MIKPLIPYPEDLEIFAHGILEEMRAGKSYKEIILHIDSLTVKEMQKETLKNFAAYHSFYL